MSEDIEIPEVKDSFEKRIAISIAIIAVLLSYIGMKGDNAKTDAIIKTNEASNKWGQFQANSMKGHMAEMEADLLKAMPNPEANAKMIEEKEADVKEYDTKKAEIKKTADSAATQIG